MYISVLSFVLMRVICINRVTDDTVLEAINYYYEVLWGLCFHRHLSSQSLIPGPFLASGHMPFPGVLQPLLPRPFWGYPSPVTGPAWWVPQDRDSLWLGLGYSPRTGYTTGGMPLAVSRRITFLFSDKMSFKLQINEIKPDNPRSSLDKILH